MADGGIGFLIIGDCFTARSCVDIGHNGLRCKFIPCVIDD
jgi:hypothetical protein